MIGSLLPRPRDGRRPRPAIGLLALVLLAAGCTNDGTADGAAAPAEGAVPASSGSAEVVPSGLEGEAPARSAPAFAGVSRGGTHASALPGQSWMVRSGVDAQAENRRPGVAGWTIPAEGGSGRKVIEGWADQVSVLAGEPVGLHVSSTARTFRVEVLRAGDYDGLWARRVWTGPPVPGGLRTQVVQDPATRMVSTRWPVSTTLDTAGWPPGAYLAKLIGSDGAESFVPFVVRDADSRGAVLLLSGVATWQAYNAWGGPSTYRGYEKRDKAEDFELRATAASFDRPYAAGSGAGGFLTDELPAIAAAERLGLRLNYAADIDLERHPEILDGAVAVVPIGHSEYWSRLMRDALTAARDDGVNLAFLGANDIHRRIRFKDSRVGPDRIMVNYKLGEDDPETSEDTTADWGRPPFSDPQSSLIGPMFACAHSTADLVVGDPGAWPFAGLGLRRGERLPDLIGPEYDRVNLKVTTPRPLQVLAHSPTVCRGAPDASDMTWYSAGSGAGVFAAGTLGWVRAMGGADRRTARVVTGVTENVLRQVARPLAGARLPAQDDVGGYYTPDGALRGVSGSPAPAPDRPDDPAAEVDPQAQIDP